MKKLGQKFSDHLQKSAKPAQVYFAWIWQTYLRLDAGNRKVTVAFSKSA